MFGNPDTIQATQPTMTQIPFRFTALPPEIQDHIFSFGVTSPKPTFATTRPSDMDLKRWILEVSGQNLFDTSKTMRARVFQYMLNLSPEKMFFRRLSDFKALLTTKFNAYLDILSHSTTPSPCPVPLDWDEFTAGLLRAVDPHTYNKVYGEVRMRDDSLVDVSLVLVRLEVLETGGLQPRRLDFTMVQV